MLDRIKALMAARQLSPSQFADLTTLPRPVVSHILSGRNKPSLEAAQKIMTAFPDVSIDWLLNGRGPMVGPAATPDPAAIPSEAAPPIAAPPAAPAARPRAVRTPPTAEPAPAVPAPAADTPLPPRAVAPPETAYSPPPAPFPAYSAAVNPTVAALAPPAPAVVQQVERPERAVRRIMVFYSDGTFSDHRPLPVEEAPFF